MSSDAKSKSSLYIVATPIGHLGDITLRAIDILKQVDVIACEDTRVTRILLSHYDIRTPTLSYREQNDATMRPQLLARLAAGESVALVSDAGTPLISDPGARLVAAAREAGFAVVPVPGASSVMAALSASGITAEPFTFIGFLPAKGSARQQAIAHYAHWPTTLVALETPQRLAAALVDLAAGLGARQAMVAREMTKRFEEFRAGTLPELADYYAQAGVKGEIVLVIAPPAAQAAPDAEVVDAMLRQALESLSVKQAAAEVAAASGLPRSDLYKRALELTGRRVIARPKSWGGSET